MLKPPSEKISAETREKLLALAEFIETDIANEFFMCATWLPSGPDPYCGSTCCFIGYIGIMNREPNCSEFSSYDAADRLGISHTQAMALFFPEGAITCKDKRQGARVLRHFAYTGEVNWSV